MAGICSIQAFYQAAVYRVGEEPVFQIQQILCFICCFQKSEERMGGIHIVSAHILPVCRNPCKANALRIILQDREPLCIS